MFLHCIMIDDPIMDQKIINVIDEQKDRQLNKTNVKAPMTEWRMENFDGFKELSIYFLHASVSASLTRFKREINPVIGAMWGMKYTSEQYTTEHDHWPATWSGTYYINPPHDGPPLQFLSDNEWIDVQPEHGMLLLFDGHIMHRVPPKKFDGDRYTVSVNIFHQLP